MTSLESFALLFPEIVLVATALVAYLGGAFTGLRHGWPVALAGISAAMSLSGGQPADGAVVASGPVTIDSFSTFVRWGVLGSGRSWPLCKREISSRHPGAVALGSAAAAPARRLARFW